jgi:predicted PurR-regulated permease PerM
VATEGMETFLKSNVLPQLRNIATSMSKNFSGLLKVLQNFILGSIIAIYLLESRDRFAVQMKMVVYAVFPRNVAEWIRREARFTNEKISGFIVGKMIDSLIIGVTCFVFVMITGMPYAMLISIIVGVTNMVPFFGPYLGGIPSAILLLTVSPVRCLVFVIFIVLLQQLDGNVIGPRILGNKLGLSAFWILFAILVFGSIWGIPGMLVGAPVFAVLYDIARNAVLTLLEKKGEKDLLDEYKK